MKLACGCDNFLPHECGEEKDYAWEGVLTVEGVKSGDNRIKPLTHIDLEQTPEQQRERARAILGLDDNKGGPYTYDEGVLSKILNDLPIGQPLVASGGQCAPFPPRTDTFAPFGGTVPKTPRGGLRYVIPPIFPEGDTTMADYANRSSEPSPEFEDTREGYATTIADWLRDSSGLEGEEITVFGPDAVVGPKGGHSQQILLAVEVEGEVQCVIVQVYCDPRTKNALEVLLHQKAEKRFEDKRIRKQIAKAVKDG